jgi:TRAP-type C4-dicarboxylate transport system permease small subunit
MGYVASAAVIIMMLTVVSDVFCRYVLNNPIEGASEIARFMMIIIVFPTMAWVALEGKHIKVDFIVDKFPRLGQIIIDSLGLLLSLGLYTIITWQSLLHSAEVDSITSMLELPQQPFYWVMSVSWGIFTVAILVLLIKKIAEGVKR